MRKKVAGARVDNAAADDVPIAARLRRRVVSMVADFGELEMEGEQ